MSESLQIDGAEPNGNVFALFARAAAAKPERAFLIVEGRTLLTYGGMLAETGRAAAWLRSLGVTAGERVLVQAHKSPVAVILYLACLRAGVVFIPLNTAYQDGELRYFLSDSEPALLVASPGLPGETVAFGGTRVVMGGDLKAAPWTATHEELPIA